MEEEFCAGSRHRVRVEVPGSQCGVGRLWYVKSTIDRAFIALRQTSFGLGSAIRSHGSGRESGGTKAARKGGGISVKGSKILNQIPAGLVWPVKKFDSKVADMARWMTRRIQRSRARCQNATTPKKSKSPEQPVEHSERADVQTDDSNTASFERR